MHVMIDILASGRLIAKPQRLLDKNGKPYAVARVRTQMHTGESSVLNVVCFAEDAAKKLLALGEGDSIAVAGTLSVKTFFATKDGTWKPSLDLVAHALLTPYHVQCRREAMTEPQEAA
jgi:hypothetical protein